MAGEKKRVARVPVQRRKASPQSNGSARGMRNPLSGLRHEIDRIFDDFSSSLPRLPFGRRAALEPFRRSHASLGAAAPAIDLLEKDREFELTAELPGLHDRDVQLFVNDGVLTIKGHKRERRDEKGADYYVSERRYGSFQRSFQIPPDVNRDRIQATFQNGVLRITLAKLAEARKKQRKIAIRGK